MAFVSYSYQQIANFQANGFEDTTNVMPSIAPDGNGGFIVSWLADDGASPDRFPLYSKGTEDGLVGSGLEFDNYGIPYDEFGSGTDPDGIGQPDLAALNNGNIVMVWREGTASGGDGAIVGTILTPNATEVTSEFTIGDSDTYTNENVAALSTGGFVVAFTDASNNILVREFNAAGVAVTDIIDTGLNTDFPSGLEITGLSGGGYAISHISSDFADHYVGVFDAGGTLVTNELITFTPGTVSPAIAELPSGFIVAAYEESGRLLFDIFDTDGFDLSNDNLVEASGVSATDPSITVMENGFFIVTYTATVGADTGIFARAYDQNGQPVQIGGQDRFTIDDDAGDQANSEVVDLGGGMFGVVFEDGTIVTAEIGQLVRRMVGDSTDELLIGDGIADQIFGRDGDDNIQGRDNNDTLFGNEGDDQIFGQDGNDSVNGGEGRDTLSGADGEDSLFGGNGNDEIFGGTGNDSINGGSQIDLLVGNNGNDTIVGSLGDDSVLGGSGDDSLFGNEGSDLIEAGQGSDEVVGGAGNDTVNGGDGNDDITGGDGFDSLSGNIGSDTISGGTGSDFVNGGNANDLLLGDDGDDTIFGGGGIDLIGGGNGADQIAGGDAGDVIDAGSGSDTVFGGNGNDTIFGGANDDTITGNANNDTVQGGTGNDEITGGTGDDVFVYSTGDGEDLFQDFIAGEGTEDQIDLSGMGADFDTIGEVLAVSTQVGNDVLVQFDANNSILLNNVTLGDLHPDDFIF